MTINRFKKIILPALIFLIAFSIGVSDTAKNASAQSNPGSCFDKATSVPAPQYTTKTACENAVTSTGETGTYYWREAPAVGTPQESCYNPNTGVIDPNINKADDCQTPMKWGISPGRTSPEMSEFEKIISGKGCISLTQFDMGGCVSKLLFYGVYMPMAGILAVAAKFFDYLIFITLNSTLLREDFVRDAWGVVRDLSNIFFILILLYIAFQMILGMGGHGAKEQIAKVVIMALLINFSMFFSGIVIDSSNILALIFYNKLQVNTKVDGQVQNYESMAGENNVSGSVADSFDLTKLMNADTFRSAGNITIANNPEARTRSQGEAPTSLIITITLIAIAVMGFAAYAFIVAGLSFLGRLIELFVLIIFSPFAFMSFSVHALDTEYIGWSAWSKRLIKTSFMAPVFMFFMFFIFLLIRGGLKTKLMTPSTNPDLFMRLLSVVIPAMLILILLLKATEFAKKGSGKFGEMAMAGAKALGGIALGAATGGAAFLGTSTIGGLARNAANDEKLKERAAAGDKGAQRRLAMANSLAKNSFDFRQTGLGKFAAKKSGMDFNKGLGVVGLDSDKFKDGTKGRDKRKAKALDEKRKTYMMSDVEAEAQDEKAKAYQHGYQIDEKQSLEAAKTKSDTSVKQWDEKHKAALEENRLTPGFNEETFNKEFVKTNGSRPPAFNEQSFKKAFKKAYEEGDTEKLRNNFGIQKDSKFSGKVKSSAEINKDRQKAYALSLANPNKKIVDGKVVDAPIRERIRNSFLSGTRIKDPRMLAATAAATAVTGPLGLLTPAVLGLASVIKDLAKSEAQARLPSVFGVHPDVIASVRKGVQTDKEEAWHHLQEAFGSVHGQDDKHDKGHPEEKHDEGHKQEPHPTNEPDHHPAEHK